MDDFKDSEDYIELTEFFDDTIYSEEAFYIMYILEIVIFTIFDKMSQF